MNRFLLTLFLAAAVVAALPAMASDRITVFAAASLKDVMDEATAGFSAQTGHEAVVSLAASSILARQIAAGAPADIYISADREWMNWLGERSLIRGESPRVVAGNSLVIVAAKAPADRSKPGTILTDGRFAMGDPRHVPAGRYAEAALSSLGLWDRVKDHAVFGENVRVALELARRGEVAAAIVYGSDQKAVPGLSLVYTFPPESHPPIVYLAAATANAGSGADAFLGFLAGPAGQVIFEEFGFAPPPE